MAALFGKKNPADDYEKNRAAFQDKVVSAKGKNADLYLELRKCEQSGQLARMQVMVKVGCMETGDLLEISYTFGNKLGLLNGIGQVQEIYQIHGTGRNEELVRVAEAYERDLVWIDVSGIDVSIVDKKSLIRRSKAKGAVAAEKPKGPVTVSSDADTSTMVNAFKSELYEFFSEGKPIRHITQDLSYALQAQRKRLGNIGISMTTEPSPEMVAAAIKMEVQKYSSSQFDVSEAIEPVKLRRTYSRAGRAIYQDDDWRICRYVLAGAKQNGDGTVTCPNCGNVAEREELLTGCPYCNTQFTIQDLSLRVAGYSQEAIEQTEREKRQGKVDIGYAVYHASGKTELDQIMQHRMKQVDPLFSASAFYNSMRNKLYTIVFAESASVLMSLADEDLDAASFYDEFKNVIDLDIQEIATKDFRANDRYILTDVVMTAMLLRFDQDSCSAEWSKETVTMSFAKHVKNKTKNIFEPSMIKCKACGGSYSLYDGKTCSYCGSEIDYPMYDWLLIDMEVSR